MIGNPPYVRQETLGEQKTYFQTHYQTFHNKADLYTYFIEKGVSFLRKNGRFGYIVANKWMRANYGTPLRKWLILHRIEEIIDFGDLPVFDQAITYPCIVIISKQQPNEVIHVTKVETLNYSDLSEYKELNQYDVNVDSMNEDGWSLSNPTESQIVRKVSSRSVLFGDFIHNEIYYGIKTALNDAFVIDAGIYNEIIQKEPQSLELLKPFLMGRDIKRYQIPTSDRYLILIPKGWTNKHKLGTKNAWNWFQNSYPAIASHLLPFAEAAQKRQDKGDYWWELRACDYYGAFEKPKFMLPDISLRGNFMLDMEGKYYCVNTAYIISSEDRYLLGILNSQLITYLYKKMSSSYRGGYLRFIYQYLVQLPIRTIDFNDPADVKRHERMVALVENMLMLHKRLAAAGSPQEKELLQRQIAYTDREIDALVYELYGLTDEEIRIVEGGE